MTNYSDPLEQRFEARIKDLARRLAIAEQQIANGSFGAAPVTSSTHPTAPLTGMRIYETDTGLEAYWNGSAWVYPPQQLDVRLLSSTTASITLNVPTGGHFSTLRVNWIGRSDAATGATYMVARLSNDSANNYLWQIDQANNAGNSPANSGATTDRIRVGTMPAATATSGYFGAGEFSTTNAAGGTEKPLSGHSVSMNATNQGFAGTYGGLWISGSTVTSVTLFPDSGNLVSGSFAVLYGET